MRGFQLPLARGENIHARLEARSRSFNVQLDQARFQLHRWAPAGLQKGRHARSGRTARGFWVPDLSSRIRTRRAALAQSLNRFSLTTAAKRLRGDHAHN
jgi:hypothetical protein